MTNVAIRPENSGTADKTYRAVAGTLQSVGKTAGEALDALAAQLNDDDETPIIVRRFRPDAFFTPAQQQRLQELMALHNAAQYAGNSLPPAERAELEALIDAEVIASGQRAHALYQELHP